MALESASEFTARPYEYLAEEVDWERNENEKKNKNNNISISQSKENFKIICEWLAHQKRIFCNIIVNGKFRKFPGSSWGALALQNRILLQYQHLLSPQFYLPAHDVNTQTLYPFSLSSREKVYLLKPNSDR